MTQEYVVLLHGMGRTKRSMKKLETYLVKEGYKVINIDYPSTKESISYLANTFLPHSLEPYQTEASSKFHFVTHSLGGIILRLYLQTHTLAQGSKIIMLAPPNKGSEVADFLKNNPLYKYSTGKAGQELTTSKDSLPNQLKPIPYDIGIIAGTKSMEPWLSLLINGDNDGKVSVDSTKLQEMRDFISLPLTHTFIMDSEKVHQQIKFFLKHGCFLHKKM